MSIVVSTSPVGAIATYTALVAELRDQQDNSDYSLTAINAAIRKAEVYFLRRLRVPDQEVSAALAVTSGIATLPADCSQIRTVLWDSAGEYALVNTDPATLKEQYGSDAGTPLAYAREGNALRLAPSATGSVRIVYYAGLVPLSDDYPSNWLLNIAPDLYVAGAQYYLCRRERDTAGAQMAMAEADGIIRTLNEEAGYKAGGNLVPKGIMQVCGARV